MSKKLLIRALGAMIVSIVGCASAPTTPPKPPVSPYTPSFAYALPEATGNGNGISIALVKPSLMAQQFMAASRALTNTGASRMGVAEPVLDNKDFTSAFTQSLSSDVESLLTKRGFTIVGPFENVNDMTFPQKKQTDLILMPSVSVSVETPGVKFATKPATFGQILASKVPENHPMHGKVGYFTSEGDCRTKGVIEFVVYEPLSMQLLWKKKVDVESVMESCAETDDDAQRVQTVIDNGEAKVLEKSYPAVMKKVDTYFNAEEMGLLKRQSQELREKKVY